MSKYRLNINNGTQGTANHVDIEGGKAGSILIGRADQCDVIVDDRRVSRRHARISWGEGWFRIEDLGSTNGTYFNDSGERIASSAAFTTMDKIYLGRAFLGLTCTLVQRDIEAERADTQPIKIHQP